MYNYGDGTITIIGAGADDVLKRAVERDKGGILKIYAPFNDFMVYCNVIEMNQMLL